MRDMVAVVATEEPQIAPNPAQPPIVAMASPPLRWPRKALAMRKRSEDRPATVANVPIRRKIAITARLSEPMAE
jgi:hypothetical protein